jgi:hypothetical protein
LAAAESPLIVLANHHQFFRIAVLWGGLLKWVLFTQFLSSATSPETHFIFLFVIDNLIRILLDSLWIQQATSPFFGRLKHLRSDCEQNSWLMLTCNYEHCTDSFLLPKTRKLVVYFHWLILRYIFVLYLLHNLLLFTWYVERSELLIYTVTNIRATQNRNSLSIPGRDNGFLSSPTHGNRLPCTPKLLSSA